MMDFEFSVLVIYFLIFGTTRGSLRHPDYPVSPEMQTYILRTTVTLSAIRDTVGIVCKDEDDTSSIVKFLLRFKNTSPVLIGTIGAKYIKHVHGEQTNNLFCFLNTIDDFEMTLTYTNYNPFFDKNGYIQFIVATAVTNKGWLMEKLKLIWRNDILNYVIVYQYRQTVEVIGYNPFNDTYYNYTNHPLGFGIYPQKLNDIYRSVLNVGMIVDNPRHKYIDGEMIGRDAILIREIAKTMNATLKLIIYADIYQMWEDIRSKKIHFSFIKHFSIRNSSHIIQPSYPTQLDYIVIAVPTADEMPRYKYLFMTFNYKLWISIGSAITIMTFINAVFARLTDFRHTSIIDSFLCIFQIFLNSVCIYIRLGKISVKILLISWTFYSLLISTAFSTTLRTSLINTKYNTEITNLDELKQSGIKVVLNYVALKEVIDQFSFIQNQLLFINDTKAIVNSMQNHDKSTAYVLYLTYMEMLVLQKDHSNRRVYNILNQHMVVGHNVYNFAKNSPYMNKIESLISLMKQFGLSKFGTGIIGTEALADTDYIALSLTHLQTAFIVLYGGLVLSAFVFIGERIQYNRKRNL